MVAPLVGAAAISAGASLFSGLTGGKGAKKAANIAAKSAAEDRALSERIYNQNVGLAQPAVTRGNAAGETINALLGIPTVASTGTAASGASDADLARYLVSVGDSKTGKKMSAYYSAHANDDPTQTLNALKGLADSGELAKLGQYQAANPYVAAVAPVQATTGAQPAQDALAQWRNSTAYQTGLAQGYDALNTGYAARGALESGAAQKALLKYGADYANANLGQYLGYLSGQQNAGLSALGSVTNSGNVLAQNMAAANNNSSTAAANSALYGAQSTQNALAGIAQAAGNYFGQSSYTSPTATNAAITANSRNYLNQLPAFSYTLPAYTSPFGR